MTLRRTLDASWRRLRTAMTPRPLYVYMGGYGVAVTWRGDRIFLPAGDVGIPPYLATRGVWEPAVERLLSRLVRPGDNVVDAGSNVGYHMLGLAHAVGPRGRVHAFEANPRLLPLITRTVELAGFRDRITLRGEAISDRMGQASFSVDPAWSAGGHLTWTGTGASYSDRVEIPTTSLDAALPDVASIDLLRMDIEGSEGLAILGAQALIARSPRLKIVTEWLPDAMALRCDLDEVIRLLREWRFSASIVGPGGRLTPVDLGALPGVGTSTVIDILLVRG